MKKYKLIFLVLPVLLLGACKKSLLQLNNPNSPTPQGSLVTEAGINAFAMGMFEKWIVNVPGDGPTNIYEVAFFMESGMGDEDFEPYSNYGGRYPANTNTIVLPAPYSQTPIHNQSGFDQIGILRSKNSRVAGDQNSFQYEWAVDYFMNGQANLLLAAIDNPALKISGDVNTKKGLLKSWAYYWKGVAYSRLGSMYLSAVLNDNPANGLTDSLYLAHDAVITAANTNFEKAVTLLQGLTSNGDYQATFRSIIPSFNNNTTIIDPAMWIRIMHTYEARNFLVNHKVKAMSATDWQTVQTLCANGMVKGDNPFVWGMAPSGINDLTTQNAGQNLGFWFHPYALHTQAGGQLTFVSERFIQDFQPGDSRLTKNFQTLKPTPVTNVLNRGYMFGTRWGATEIDSGGSFGSQTHKGVVPISPTWEENTLMIAEAKIRSGSDINGGLTLIDQVRTSQGSNLPATAGTGLTQALAAEQLRSERRVALYLRGLAWYDARRWSVNEPLSAGGGRTNANLFLPGTLLGTGMPNTLLPCTVEYNFVDYWDVPANELDFNGPSSGSAPIKN